MAEPTLFTFRSARPEETPELWLLRNRAARAACAGHYAEEVLDGWLTNPLPARFADLVADGLVLVAEDDRDRILGYAALNAAGAEVEAVFVDPAAMGAGLGKRLLAAIEAAASARGLRHLELSASLNAVPFYAAAGYAELRHKDCVLSNGVSLASVLMRKSLVSD